MFREGGGPGPELQFNNESAPEKEPIVDAVRQQLRTLLNGRIINPTFSVAYASIRKPSRNRWGRPQPLEYQPLPQRGVRDVIAPENPDQYGNSQAWMLEVQEISDAELHGGSNNMSAVAKQRAERQSLALQQLNDRLDRQGEAARPAHTTEIRPLTDFIDAMAFQQVLDKALSGEAIAFPERFVDYLVTTQDRRLERRSDEILDEQAEKRELAEQRLTSYIERAKELGINTNEDAYVELGADGTIERKVEALGKWQTVDGIEVDPELSGHDAKNYTIQMGVDEDRLSDVGTYNTQRGVIGFIDDQGRMRVAPYTPERLRALVDRNYQPNEKMYVVFSRGEKPVDLAAREFWQELLSEVQ